MATHHYRGWTYDYNAARPATGLWRAVRHGVGICANNEKMLKRMIDVRVTEAEEDQARRDEERGRDFDPDEGHDPESWRGRQWRQFDGQ